MLITQLAFKGGAKSFLIVGMKGEFSNTDYTYAMRKRTPPTRGAAVAFWLQILVTGGLISSLRNRGCVGFLCLQCQFDRGFEATRKPTYGVFEVADGSVNVMPGGIAVQHDIIVRFNVLAFASAQFR